LEDFDFFNLGAIPMREVLKRMNLEAGAVDEVFLGMGDSQSFLKRY